MIIDFENTDIDVVDTENIQTVVASSECPEKSDVFPHKHTSPRDTM